MMGHPIIKLTHTPSLAEMTALTLESLPKLLKFQSTLDMRRLPHFGLGWFKHAASDTVWLGLVEPNLDDHDRWLLCVNPWDNEEWYLVLTEGQLSGRAIQFDDLKLNPNLVRPTYIRDLVERLTVQDAELTAVTRHLGVAAVSPARMVAYKRLLPSSSLEDKARLGTIIDLREAHALVHHYDDWLARNPQAKDLPRDIVLRMHNLSFVTSVNPSPIVLS